MREKGEGGRTERDGESNSARWRHRNGDGQTDRKTAQEDRNRKADCSDNKRVYRPISNSSMSFYLSASPSCVDTLVPCCLTEVACWMLWKIMSPNNVSA